MSEAPIRLDELWSFCRARLDDDERRAKHGYYSDTHWERFTTEAHLYAWHAWRDIFPREQWNVKANDAISEAARDGIRNRITAHEKDRSSRTLADIAFKRELLAEHEPVLQAAVKDDEVTPMLVCRVDGLDCAFTQGLAALHDDHEDYKEAWRP
ncbi:DUF6221 family protein [Streptomyces scabiei]|uniref:DUF6221 family protein n=1 Tax=Streptomyces scabiei TaxID=1930 RepID=UPI0029A96434|nr:DUF6221 family protein [Streptomyces scabiei]MDX2658341.1 DUF6221 family protein [Streptomyces scabiei]MDX2870497.1 DUF6221 family protein [Streptomyces scabiei]